MPRRITLHLSKSGSQVLRRGILKLTLPSSSISGTLLSYDAEGIWFQDDRLLRENRMVLVKWNFIDAILSDIPEREPVSRREAGFVARVENREQQKRWRRKNLTVQSRT
ncbi:MAG: hypothetical protein IH846_00930 [Acidobacteria bacterium]|nr:hypothetical protein [Acidobacteriota bacterium]